MLWSSAIGHDAIGAEVSTALDDGYKASWSVWKSNVFNAISQAMFLGPGLKLIKIAGLEEEVHLRKTLAKLGCVAIHQASGDSQQGFGFFYLELFERVELAHYPILGALTYNAGIEQNNIGFCSNICLAQSTGV